MVKIFVRHPNNTWDLVNIKLCDTKTHGRATMVKMFVSHPNNTWNFVNMKLCDTKTHGRATIDENVCQSS